MSNTLLRWISHYPRVLKEYWTEDEDGLEEIEEQLRAEANRQPKGKFSKGQALYVPCVPLPPADWRHNCGHCRFWIDHGPGKPGECMIVGKEGDYSGGKAIHEKAGCALWMPPAGESAFAWASEQLHPTGADLVRGEFHSLEHRQDAMDITEQGQREEHLHDRHTTDPDVGTSIAPAGAEIGVELVADGFTAPMALAFDPTGDRRLIADQTGQIHVHNVNGLRDEPLLDLRDQIVDLRPQYDERGLLGIELHPEFADNRRFFVRYSAQHREGTPEEYDHTEVLAEFETPEDRSQVDPTSERTLLEIPSPQFNHNAGAIEFGPGGYLYVAMGDGGGEGDRDVGHVIGGNGQDITENLLGGILRIDVDSEQNDNSYGIPEDNPLVGEDGRDEYYAWGLRNPWRMSFDSEGRLFVADVGQHLFEEVNIVEKSGNYGWNNREGFHCFDPENPTDPPEICPDMNNRSESLHEPILEYPHIHEDEVIGSAVIGGYLYEGSSIPALQGKYVFGDWAETQNRPSGRLFAAEPPAEDEGPWSIEELVVAESANGRFNRDILGFGRGPDDELYVLSSTTHVPSGNTGAVHRLIAPT